MRPEGSTLAAGLAVAATLYVIGNPWTSAQSRGGASQTRVAAVPNVKGGQDMYGPYDIVADWPKDLSTLPGHEGWTFGAGRASLPRARTVFSSFSAVSTTCMASQWIRKRAACS